MVEHWPAAAVRKMAWRLLEKLQIEGTHTDFMFMTVILETFIEVLYKEELSTEYTSTADHSPDLQHRNSIFEKPSLVLIAFLE
jgi:hypothetical protein